MEWDRNEPASIVCLCLFSSPCGCNRLISSDVQWSRGKGRSPSAFANGPRLGASVFARYGVTQRPWGVDCLAVPCPPDLSLRLRKEPGMRFRRFSSFLASVMDMASLVHRSIHGPLAFVHLDTPVLCCVTRFSISSDTPM